MAELREFIEDRLNPLHFYDMNVGSGNLLDSGSLNVPAVPVGTPGYLAGTIEANLRSISVNGTNYFTVAGTALPDDFVVGVVLKVNAANVQDTTFRQVLLLQNDAGRSVSLEIQEQAAGKLRVQMRYQNSGGTTYTLVEGSSTYRNTAYDHGFLILMRVFNTWESGTGVLASIHRDSTWDDPESFAYTKSYQVVNAGNPDTGFKLTEIGGASYATGLVNNVEIGGVFVTEAMLPPEDHRRLASLLYTGLDGHKRQTQNNATSSLRSPMTVTSGTALIQTTDGHKFPRTRGEQYFRVTLVDPIDSTNFEICLARKTANTSMVLIRGMEFTKPQAWPTGTIVEARLTEVSMRELLTGALSPFQSEDGIVMDARTSRFEGYQNEANTDFGTTLSGALGPLAGGNWTANVLFGMGNVSAGYGNVQFGIQNFQNPSASSSIQVGRFNDTLNAWSATTVGAYKASENSDSTLALGRGWGIYGTLAGNSDSALCAGYYARVQYNSPESLAVGAWCTAGPDAGQAVVVGYDAYAYAVAATSLGSFTKAHGYHSAALGPRARAYGSYSMSFGHSYSRKDRANTIGFRAECFVPGVTNIAGPIITKKGALTAGNNEFERWAGTEVTLMSGVVDLTLVAEFNMALSAGSMFFPNEVGVILVAADTVTGQPTIRFGRGTGSEAALLAAVATTGLAAEGDRNRFSSLLSDAAEMTTLSAGVTAGATGTTVSGRFYFKGHLVERETSA
jgi:hypothetical protein